MPIYKLSVIYLSNSKLSQQNSVTYVVETVRKHTVSVEGKREKAEWKEMRQT